MNALSETIKAPSISYDFQCIGPREESRQHYLDLMDKITDAKASGDEVLSSALQEEANSLLEVKWNDKIENLVTTVGKTDIVDKYLKGSAYTAAFFMGLKGTGSAAAGDTLASHAGWSEVNPYTGNRPAITWGTTSGGSNTATAVAYSITSGATVAGAFVCTVNTGTSGTLYSAGDFAASRTVANGDTLNVTPTLSVA